MKKYDVTITRTGGIIVEAKNKEDAIDKVLSLNIDEIEKFASLTGWEPSDAIEIEGE